MPARPSTTGLSVAQVVAAQVGSKCPRCDGIVAVGFETFCLAWRWHEPGVAACLVCRGEIPEDQRRTVTCSRECRAGRENILRAP